MCLDWQGYVGPDALAASGRIQPFRSTGCRTPIVRSTIDTHPAPCRRRTPSPDPLVSSRPSLESQIPVKPVELLVLTMLSAGERHGYGIRQDIIEQTHGAIELEA